MKTPEEERSGEPEVTEVAQPAVVPPAPAEAPTKWVVFRSVDKGYKIVFKAGYVDKSHGIASYVPSEVVPFEDFHLRIPDIPKNEQLLKKIRTHEGYGLRFFEVPDLSQIEDLPPIAELRALPDRELLTLCAQREIQPPENTSKESIILALLEGKKRE